MGWRTANRMPTELPLDALEMALWVRGRADHDVAGVTHHSDAGRQYTALRYSDRLAEVGAIASIGTVGDSYDNALAESVVGLYKTECVKIDGHFRTVDELELATLSAGRDVLVAIKDVRWPVLGVWLAAQDVRRP